MCDCQFIKDFSELKGGDGHLEKILDSSRQTVGEFKDQAKNIGSALSDNVDTVTGTTFGAIGNTKTATMETIQDLVNTLNNGVKSVIDLTDKTTGSIIKALKKIMNSDKDAEVEFVSSSMNRLRGAFQRKGGNVALSYVPLFAQSLVGAAEANGFKLQGSSDEAKAAYFIGGAVEVIGATQQVANKMEEALFMVQTVGEFAERYYKSVNEDKLNEEGKRLLHGVKAIQKATENTLKTLTNVLGEDIKKIRSKFVEELYEKKLTAHGLMKYIESRSNPTDMKKAFLEMFQNIDSVAFATDRVKKALGDMKIDEGDLLKMEKLDYRKMIHDYVKGAENMGQKIERESNVKDLERFVESSTKYVHLLEGANQEPAVGGEEDLIVNGYVYNGGKSAFMSIDKAMGVDLEITERFKDSEKRNLRLQIRNENIKHLRNLAEGARVAARSVSDVNMLQQEDFVDFVNRLRMLQGIDMNELFNRMSSKFSTYYAADFSNNSIVYDLDQLVEACNRVSKFMEIGSFKKALEEYIKFIKDSMEKIAKLNEFDKYKSRTDVTFLEGAGDPYCNDMSLDDAFRYLGGLETESINDIIKIFTFGLNIGRMKKGINLANEDLDKFESFQHDMIRDILGREIANMEQMMLDMTSNYQEYDNFPITASLFKKVMLNNHKGLVALKRAAQGFDQKLRRYHVAVSKNSDKVTDMVELLKKVVVDFNWMDSDVTELKEFVRLLQIESVRYNALKKDQCNVYLKGSESYTRVPKLFNYDGERIYYDSVISDPATGSISKPDTVDPNYSYIGRDKSNTVKVPTSKHVSGDNGLCQFNLKLMSAKPEDNGIVKFEDSKVHNFKLNETKSSVLAEQYKNLAKNNAYLGELKDNENIPFTPFPFGFQDCAAVTLPVLTFAVSPDSKIDSIQTLLETKIENGVNHYGGSRNLPCHLNNPTGVDGFIPDNNIKVKFLDKNLRSDIYDLAIDRLYEAVGKIGALQNLMSIFQSIDSAYESKETGDMSIQTIYDNIIDYIVLTTLYPVIHKDPVSGKYTASHIARRDFGKNICIPSNCHDLTWYSRMLMNNAVSLEYGYQSDSPDGGNIEPQKGMFNPFDKTKIDNLASDHIEKDKSGERFTKHVGAFQDQLDKFAYQYFTHDQLLTMILKGIMSKSLSVLAMYDVVKFNVGNVSSIANKMGTYNIRTIYGGASYNYQRYLTEEVKPELTELYTRLWIYGLFYRNLFITTYQENHEANPTFQNQSFAMLRMGLLPEIGSNKFDGIIKYFMLQNTIKNADSDNIHNLGSDNGSIGLFIHEVNMLAEKESNKDKILAEFVQEVNRRYGVVSSINYHKYIKKEDEKYNKDIDLDFVDPYSLSTEIKDQQSRFMQADLLNKNPGGKGKVPTDDYVGDFSLFNIFDISSEEKERVPFVHVVSAIYQFRKKLQKMVKELDNQAKREYSIDNNTVSRYGSSTGLIMQVRLFKMELEDSKNSKVRFDKMAKFLQSLDAQTGFVRVPKELEAYRELVLAPAGLLARVYTRLAGNTKLFGRPEPNVALMKNLNIYNLASVLSDLVSIRDNGKDLELDFTNLASVCTQLMKIVSINHNLLKSGLDATNLDHLNYYIKTMIDYHRELWSSQEDTLHIEYENLKINPLIDIDEHLHVVKTQRSDEMNDYFAYNGNESLSEGKLLLLHPAIIKGDARKETYPDMQFQLFNKYLNPDNVYKTFDYVLISIYRMFWEKYQTGYAKIFKNFSSIVTQVASSDEFYKPGELGGMHSFRKEMPFSDKIMSLYKFIINQDEKKNYVTSDLSSLPEGYTDDIRTYMPLFMMLCKHIIQTAAIHNRFAEQDKIYGMGRDGKLKVVRLKNNSKSYGKPASDLLTSSSRNISISGLKKLQIVSKSDIAATGQGFKDKYQDFKNEVNSILSDNELKSSILDEVSKYENKNLIFTIASKALLKRLIKGNYDMLFLGDLFKNMKELNNISNLNNVYDNILSSMPDEIETDEITIDPSVLDEVNSLMKSGYKLAESLSSSSDVPSIKEFKSKFADILPVYISNNSVDVNNDKKIIGGAENNIFRESFMDDNKVVQFKDDTGKNVDDQKIRFRTYETTNADERLKLAYAAVLFKDSSNDIIDMLKNKSSWKNITNKVKANKKHIKDLSKLSNLNESDILKWFNKEANNYKTADVLLKLTGGKVHYAAPDLIMLQLSGKLTFDHLKLYANEFKNIGSLNDAIKNVLVDNKPLKLKPIIIVPSMSDEDINNITKSGEGSRLVGGGLVRKPVFEPKKTKGLMLSEPEKGYIPSDQIGISKTGAETFSKTSDVTGITVTGFTSDSEYLVNKNISSDEKKILDVIENSKVSESTYEQYSLEYIAKGLELDSMTADTTVDINSLKRIMKDGDTFSERDWDIIKEETKKSLLSPEGTLLGGRDDFVLEDSIRDIMGNGESSTDDKYKNIEKLYVEYHSVGRNSISAKLDSLSEIGPKDISYLQDFAGDKSTLDKYSSLLMKNEFINGKRLEIVILELYKQEEYVNFNLIIKMLTCIWIGIDKSDLILGALKSVIEYNSDRSKEKLEETVDYLYDICDNEQLFNLIRGSIEDNLKYVRDHRAERENIIKNNNDLIGSSNIYKILEQVEYLDGIADKLIESLGLVPGDASNLPLMDKLNGSIILNISYSFNNFIESSLDNILGVGNWKNKPDLLRAELTDVTAEADRVYPLIEDSLKKVDPNDKKQREFLQFLMSMINDFKNKIYAKPQDFVEFKNNYELYMKVSSLIKFSGFLDIAEKNAGADAGGGAKADAGGALDNETKINILSNVKNQSNKFINFDEKNNNISNFKNTIIINCYILIDTYIKIKSDDFTPDQIVRYSESFANIYRSLASRIYREYERVINSNAYIENLIVNSVRETLAGYGNSNSTAYKSFLIKGNTHREPAEIQTAMIMYTSLVRLAGILHINRRKNGEITNEDINGEIAKNVKSFLERTIDVTNTKKYPSELMINISTSIINEHFLNEVEGYRETAVFYGGKIDNVIIDSYKKYVSDNKGLLDDSMLRINTILLVDNNTLDYLMKIYSGTIGLRNAEDKIKFILSNYGIYDNLFDKTDDIQKLEIKYGTVYTNLSYLEGILNNIIDERGNLSFKKFLDSLETNGKLYSDKMKNRNIPLNPDTFDDCVNLDLDLSKNSVYDVVNKLKNGLEVVTPLILLAFNSKNESIHGDPKITEMLNSNIYRRFDNGTLPENIEKKLLINRVDGPKYEILFGDGYMLINDVTIWGKGKNLYEDIINSKEVLTKKDTETIDRTIADDPSVKSAITTNYITNLLKALFDLIKKKSNDISTSKISSLISFIRGKLLESESSKQANYADKNSVLRKHLVVNGWSAESIKRRAQNAIRYATELYKILQEVYNEVARVPKYGQFSSYNNELVKVFNENKKKDIPISFAVDAIPLFKAHTGTHGKVGAEQQRGLGLNCLGTQDLHELLYGDKAGMFKALNIFMLDNKSYNLSLKDFNGFKAIADGAGIGSQVSSNMAQGMSTLLKYLYELQMKDNFSTKFSLYNCLRNPKYGITTQCTKGILMNTIPKWNRPDPYNFVGLVTQVLRSKVNNGDATVDPAAVKFIGANHAGKYMFYGPEFSNYLSSDLLDRQYYKYITDNIPSRRKEAFGTTDKANEIDKLMAINILDTGIFPINIHAMMSDVPLSTLINNNYTADLMADKLFLKYRNDNDYDASSADKLFADYIKYPGGRNYCPKEVNSGVIYDSSNGFKTEDYQDRYNPYPKVRFSNGNKSAEVVKDTYDNILSDNAKLIPGYYQENGIIECDKNIKDVSPRLIFASFALPLSINNNVKNVYANFISLQNLNSRILDNLSRQSGYKGLQLVDISNDNVNDILYSGDYYSDQHITNLSSNDLSFGVDKDMQQPILAIQLYSEQLVKVIGEQLQRQLFDKDSFRNVQKGLLTMFVDDTSDY